MASHPWNKHGADVALVACGHSPQNIITVKDVDVFVDQNYMLELREGRERGERGLALTPFITDRTLFELQDGQVLSTPGRVSVNIQEASWHAIFHQT